MKKQVRAVLVVVALGGCGGSETDVDPGPLTSSTKALAQTCGRASATSDVSYDDARRIAAADIAGLCDAHGGVSRIWPCLTNADAPPHLAECRYCCNQ